MTQSIARPGSWWVVAATAMAWLGFFIHNIADLPGQSLFSLETGLPTLVYLVLFLAWWRFPSQRVTLWLLFGWGLLNLIGGGLSVIPFPFLPFYPEQSWRHYFFHLMYGAAQLPLIAVTGAWLRHSHSSTMPPAMPTCGDDHTPGRVFGTRHQHFRQRRKCR